MRVNNTMHLHTGFLAVSVGKCPMGHGDCVGKRKSERRMQGRKIRDLLSRST
jgi:hypothetical protein